MRHSVIAFLGNIFNTFISKILKLVPVHWPDHNGMNVEIKPNTWKMCKTLLNNPWVKEAVTREIETVFNWLKTKIWYINIQKFVGYSKSFAKVLLRGSL